MSVAASEQTRLTREDWLDAGLELLTGAGVERVKITTLADRLGSSRSSFYWFFANRQALLDALLQAWDARNTRGIVRQAGLPAATITEAVCNVFRCWVDPGLFSPRLDFAVREWARRSQAVHRVVEAADAARVEALAAMFRRHDYAPGEAFIRARVLYYMQIGYYAIDLKETLEDRLALVPDYLRSFTGREPTEAEIAAFSRFARAQV
ncbi:MAG: TetR/AcrR family transcriptional regulator [Alphaproteobacteria bacterium]|nr:MAG: TetR/AcrR family transcriptional regulator [Alphaproteobacteria bacterium]